VASYAEPSDLLARYDAREIGDLVADDGEQIGAAALATDTNVLAALSDASGQIEAALVVGNRYTASALEGLTGNSLALLKRITCMLAICHLMDRRPAGYGDAAEKRQEQALDYLERLRNGENVFNLSDQKDAGEVDVEGPTYSEYDQQQMWSHRPRNAFYPGLRLPNGR